MVQSILYDGPTRHGEIAVGDYTNATGLAALALCKAMLTGTATLNFSSIATNVSADLTITVNGAVSGDVVILGIPAASHAAGLSYYGFVSAANTVTVRACNNSAGSIDPASGTFRAVVLQYV